MTSPIGLVAILSGLCALAMAAPGDGQVTSALFVEKKNKKSGV